jgi:hypothetical protein
MVVINRPISEIGWCDAFYFRKHSRQGRTAPYDLLKSKLGPTLVRRRNWIGHFQRRPQRVILESHSEPPLVNP